MLVLPLVYRGGDLRFGFRLRVRTATTPWQALCVQQPSTLLF